MTTRTATTTTKTAKAKRSKRPEESEAEGKAENNETSDEAETVRNEDAQEAIDNADDQVMQQHSDTDSEKIGEATEEPADTGATRDELAVVERILQRLEKAASRGNGEHQRQTYAKDTHLYEEMDVHVTNDSEMATSEDPEAEVESVENGEVNGDGTKARHQDTIHGGSSQYVVVINVEVNHRMMVTALEAIARTMALADDGEVTARTRTRAPTQQVAARY
eukprot:jgi/Phyca11/16273/fgenesh1_pg.PHYCAscaffold_19_\